MERQKDELEFLNETYHKINRHMNIVYRFITRGYEAFKKPIDYGCGPAIALIEVHTLSLIATHPGITAADIRREWGRYPSLSAVSQNVSKLLKKGLIYQKKFGDGNRKGLYVTKLGEALHRAHVQYDIADEENIITFLKQSATEEELKSFFKVMDLWGDLMLQNKLKISGDRPIINEG